MQSKEIQQLAELVNEIKVAMLTGLDGDGELKSRPMATSEIKEDRFIYFFTHAQSPHMQEMGANHKVNICYMDRDEQVYVSVSGHAKIIRDQDKINELWNPHLKAWFPKGKEDPELNLLRVEISKAEYWDAPGNKMVHLLDRSKQLQDKEKKG